MDLRRLYALKISRTLPLILTGIGSLIVHLYLYSVRIYAPYDVSLLFLGVFMQSLGTTLLLLPLVLWRERKVSIFVFMACVLSISSSISYLNTTRFSVPLEVDVAVEYHTARVVEEFGWNPQLIVIKPPGGVRGPVGGFDMSETYIGAISISLLPCMVAQILGTSILDVFTFFYPMIVALMPLFFFVTVRKFFGDDVLTYLSVALIPQFFAFTDFSANYRQSIGIILLYLFLFCLVDRSPKNLLLSLLFTLGIVSAHYTMGYLTVFLLLSLLLFTVLRPVSERFKILWRSKMVTLPLFVGCFSTVVSWMMVIQPHLATNHMLMLVRYILHGIRIISPAPETGYFTSLPRGPVVSYWFMLQLLLIGIGGLISLKGLLKDEFDELESTAFIIGYIFAGYLLAAIFLQSKVSNPFVEPQRGMAWALPFMMLFLALCLVRIGKAIYGRFLVTLFILLMLPMNMMLPSHAYDIRYHPISKQSAEELRIQFYRGALSRPLGIDYVMAGEWIAHQIFKGWSDRSYANTSWAFTDHVALDQVGWVQLQPTPTPNYKMERYRPPELLPLEIQVERHVRPIQYLVVSDLYLKFGVWYWQYTWREEEVAFYDPTSLLQDPIAQLVYNNNALALFYSDE